MRHVWMACFTARVLCKVPIHIAFQTNGFAMGKRIVQMETMNIQIAVI